MMASNSCGIILPHVGHLNSVVITSPLFEHHNYYVRDLFASIISPSLQYAKGFKKVKLPPYSLQQKKASVETEAFNYSA